MNNRSLWFQKRKSIKKVIINSGVTSIGSENFSNCSNLESVTIPDSVTIIGDGAFGYCTSLESITILNPECVIDDGFNTIFDTYYYNGTIKGYKGSTAEAYANKYGYTFESLGDAPASKNTYGDANCDGKVTVADAVAILQSIGNRDKYGLTADGLANADVDGVAGITGKDALVIQQVDAGIYKAEDLPLKAK